MIDRKYQWVDSSAQGICDMHCASSLCHIAATAKSQSAVHPHLCFFKVVIVNLPHTP
jgi:hypothetical protein